MISNALSIAGHEFEAIKFALRKQFKFVLRYLSRYADSLTEEEKNDIVSDASSSNNLDIIAVILLTYKFVPDSHHIDKLASYFVRRYRSLVFNDEAGENLTAEEKAQLLEPLMVTFDFRVRSKSLELVIKEEDVETLEEMLSSTTILTHFTEEDYNQLSATAYNHPKIIELLLTSPSWYPASNSDNYQNKFLLEAIKQQDLELVRVLVLYEAKYINPITFELDIKVSPLMKAIQMRDAGLTKILLEAVLIDPTQDSCEYLLTACSLGFLEGVDLLLKDERMKGCEKNGSFSLAAKNSGHKYISDILVQHGYPLEASTPQTDGLESALYDQELLTQFLSNANEDINVALMLEFLQRLQEDNIEKLTGSLEGLMYDTSTLQYVRGILYNTSNRTIRGLFKVMMIRLYQEQLFDWVNAIFDHGIVHGDFDNFALMRVSLLFQDLELWRSLQNDMANLDFSNCPQRLLELQSFALYCHYNLRKVITIPSVPNVKCSLVHLVRSSYPGKFSKVIGHQVSKAEVRDGLMMLASCGYVSSLYSILEAIEKDSIDLELYEDFLFESIKHGHSNLVKAALPAFNMKPDSSSQNKPIMEAIRCGSYELVNFLLDHDHFSYNFGESLINSPLLIAIAMNDPDMIDLILKKTRIDPGTTYLEVEDDNSRASNYPLYDTITGESVTVQRGSNVIDQYDNIYLSAALAFKRPDSITYLLRNYRIQRRIDRKLRAKIIQLGDPAVSDVFIKTIDPSGNGLLLNICENPRYSEFVDVLNEYETTLSKEALNECGQLMLRSMKGQYLSSLYEETVPNLERINEICDMVDLIVEKYPEQQKMYTEVLRMAANNETWKLVKRLVLNPKVNAVDLETVLEAIDTYEVHRKVFKYLCSVTNDEAVQRSQAILDYFITKDWDPHFCQDIPSGDQMKTFIEQRIDAHESRQKFIDACQRAKVEKVAKLVEQGKVDINMDQGFCLFTAANQRDQAMLEYLLSQRNIKVFPSQKNAVRRAICGLQEEWPDGIGLVSKFMFPILPRNICIFSEGSPRSSPERVRLIKNQKEKDIQESNQIPSFTEKAKVMESTDLSQSKGSRKEFRRQ